MLALSFFLCLMTDMATAENNPMIKIKLEAGVNGKVSPGVGFPVQVSIENDGPLFRGDLTIDFYPSYQTGGSKVIQIELPEKSSKTFHISLPGVTEDHPSLYQNKPTIHLYKGSWKDREEVPFTGDKSLKVSFITSNSLGILSSQYDQLKELRILPDATIESMQLKKDTVPYESQGLKMFDYLIVDQFSLAELDKEKQKAIEDWIKEGGVLIAGASSNASQAYGDLYSLLPMKPEAEMTVSTDFLKNGNKQPLEKNIHIFTGSIDSSSQVIAMSDSTPVIFSKKIGEGQIIQTAFSLSDPAISTWDGYGGWFEQLLNQNSYVEINSNKYSGNLLDDLYYQFAEVNEYFPGSQFSIGLFILILTVYLILIVPVLYFVLRKIDKREHAWWLIPSFALLVSVVMFGIGAKDRLGKPQLNQLGVYSANQGYLSGYQATTLLSNTGGNYQLSVPKKDFEVIPLTNDQTSSKKAVISENRNDYFISLPKVEYWSTRTLYGKSHKKISGQFETNLSIENQTLKGSVTNKYPIDFSEVFIWSGDERISLGNVKAGGTIHVNHKMKSAYLHSPSYKEWMGMNGPHANKDFSKMKKESLESAVSSLLLSKLQNSNDPVISGYTKSPVVDVKVIDKEAKKESLNLIISPLQVSGNYTGPFTLKSEELQTHINVVKGAIIEKMAGPKNEMLLEDGEYDFSVALPKTFNVGKLSLNEIRISLNGSFIDSQLYNPTTGEYLNVESNRLILEAEDNPQQYLSKNGELILRLKKESKGDDPYVQMPTITLKGEVSP